MFISFEIFGSGEDLAQLAVIRLADIESAVLLAPLWQKMLVWRHFAHRPDVIADGCSDVQRP